MHSHSHELSLGLSFLLGALHALEPGHGKTAMFVYLLDGKRSFWHPVVMGLSTAFSHSVSLFAIAFSVHIAHHVIAGDHIHEQEVSTVLQWISAVLVIAVGGFLLLQSARGRKGACCGNHHRGSCRNHLHGQHGDAIDSTVSAEPTLVPLSLSSAPVEARNLFPSPLAENKSVRSSFRMTAVLGLAVGLLPCPTALAAYFTGLSSGSPGTSYLIIGLFAAGIASSLSIVGILLQYFGEKFGSRSKRLVDLPWNYIRATLILSIGLIYVVRLFNGDSA